MMNKKALKGALAVITGLMMLFVASTHPFAKPMQGNDSETLIRQTILGFYEIQFDTWNCLDTPDFSNYLDMNTVTGHNKTEVFRAVRDNTVFYIKYIPQHANLEQFRQKDAYSIEFKTISIKNDFATVVADIHLENQGVYPFFVTAGENKFDLQFKNGRWLITNHVYSGYWYDAYEKERFEYEGPESLIKDRVSEYGLSLSECSLDPSDAVAVIQNEGLEESHFNPNEIQSEPLSDLNQPDGGLRSNCVVQYPYNASRAVSYANTYYSNPNSLFYVDSSDCTNFVSQCISYGFGSGTATNTFASFRRQPGPNYSSGWSADGGGGYEAWESVVKHWEYIVGRVTDGPRGTAIAAAYVNSGDVVQIFNPSKNRYAHSVIMINSTTVAEHSPNQTRALSDFTNTKRYYRPTTFQETFSSHVLTYQNTNSLDSHRCTCSRCGNVSYEAHDWQETQINPSKDSGLRYIPGYVCTKCNLTVPAWMID